MTKNDIMIIADYQAESDLSLDELSEICHIPTEVVLHLIQYEIIHPQKKSNQKYIFTVNELERIKAALRLHHDLDLNFAGVAIVLDLLDELHELRDETLLLHKHYKIEDDSR